MKKLGILTLLCAFSVMVGQCLYFLRDGFTPRRFIANVKSLETCAINEETKQILSQPFYFLGRGRQCYAFGSNDGKHVLKILRTDNYKIPFWARALPLSHLRKTMKEKRAHRKRYSFESFRIAKEEIPEITGTLALHLGKSEPTKQQITIVDALGMRYHLPVQTTLFVLQNKHTLWTPAFLAAKKKKDVKQQELLLDSFVDLVVQRSQKGIMNRDGSFYRNYAFENGKGYQIDLGDLYKDPNFVYQKAVRDSLRPLQEWLAKIDPPMLDHLNTRIENLSF